jgi:hypothetical protein
MRRQHVISSTNADRLRSVLAAVVHLFLERDLRAGKKAHDHDPCREMTRRPV